MKRSMIAVGVVAVGLAVSALPVDAQRTPMIVRDFPMGGGNYFLRNPEFVDASKATFLKDDDKVIGVEGNGVSKAYPAAEAIWHHAVEDQLGKLPIFVTF